METSSAPRTWHEAQVVLRDRLPRYEERPQQTRLAEAIERSFADGTPLVGQAGTGTGKSLAALVPMILSGQPSYYSTGTKALQAQLMDKDLPFLRENLGVDFRYAMLQGRSNYVCHAQLAQTVSDIDPVLADIREAVAADDEANAPADFQVTTRESLGFEVADQTWRKASISSDNCTRKECPFYAGHCRAQYAKAVAEKAQVVVVNHALVATDAKLFADTGGEVSMLGAIENMVIDEAHELEQYVINALEGKFSAATFRALAAFLRSTASKLDIDTDDIDPLLTDMQAAAEAMLAELPTEGRIRHFQIIEQVEAIETAIKSLDPLVEMFDEVDGFLLETRAQTVALSMAKRRLANLRQKMTDFLLKRDSEVVRFIEIDGDHKYVVTRPIEIGDWARENMWTRYTPVVMSATILVDGSADFINRTLGIDRPEVLDVGSPFDYQANSRLYVPSTITAPVGRDRDRWAAEMYPQVARMVEASKGRALLLFTSKSQMRDAFFTLRNDFKRLGLECKMQGDESNARLTRWLRETGGVLFGTKSFFTGIDIQGSNLSLVVIDKLPFPVPTEPVFEARTELLEARGRNAFSELTIPEMTLPLMQAFGRLIRTMTDKGVVAIMDPRITGKGYGKKISRSIPAPLTVDLDAVERFLEAVA